MKMKYKQVRDALRKKIEEGDFAPGTKMPPHAELAKLFDTTDITLRRGLQDLVREGLIVRKRGSGTFVCDPSRTPLFPGRNLRIGIVWNDCAVYSMVSRSFAGRILDGILKGLAINPALADFKPPVPEEATVAVWNDLDRGVRLDCVGEPWPSPGRRPPVEAIRKYEFDALIIMSAVRTDWIPELLALDTPVILVDTPLQQSAAGADSVVADPVDAYREAVNHLLASGYQRIHFAGMRYKIQSMTNSKPSQAGDEPGPVNADDLLRISAFRQAMTLNRLHVPEDWIHFVYHNEKYVRPLGLRLARLSEDQRPQALICHSTMEAEVLTRVFAEEGLPLATVAATDQPYTGPAFPVHVDAFEMGLATAELLISRFQRPARPQLNVGVKMRFLAPHGSGANPAEIQVAATPVHAT